MSADPLAGTDLARVELPENVYGFGWAEMRYLLGRHDTPASRTALVSLGFDAAPTDEVVAAAAVASLLARGLAAAEGDRAVSRGEAAVLEGVLGRGVRWTGISMRDGDRGDLMVVIEDGDVVALLQPRSLGTWFLGLSDDVDHPADVLGAAVERMRSTAPGARFGVETRTLQGSVGTRYLRPEGDGWTVSDTAEGERRPVGAGGVASELKALLPGRPA